MQRVLGIPSAIGGALAGWIQWRKKVATTEGRQVLRDIGKNSAVRRSSLQVEGAGEGDAGLAGLGALDAADAEKFLAALLEVGFDGLHKFWRDHQNHSHAHVEGLKKLVGVNLSDLAEIFENCGNGPGGEIDFGFDAAWEDARQVPRDAAAGDVRQGGNPALG